MKNIRIFYLKTFIFFVVKFSIYEGESISNQPIPFRWTETVTIFMLCFNICFIHGNKIAHISSRSLIRY